MSEESRKCHYGEQVDETVRLRDRIYGRRIYQVQESQRYFDGCDGNREMVDERRNAGPPARESM